MDPRARHLSDHVIELIRGWTLCSEGSVRHRFPVHRIAKSVLDSTRRNAVWVVELDEVHRSPFTISAA